MLYVLACFLLFAGGGISGVFATIDWFAVYKMYEDNYTKLVAFSAAATSVCLL